MTDEQGGCGNDEGVPTNVFHHVWGKRRSEGYAICDGFGQTALAALRTRAKGE